MAVRTRQLYCETCAQLRPFDKPGPNHVLHLLLSCMTFGVWIIMWFFAAIADSPKEYNCRTCGGRPSSLRMHGKPRQRNSLALVLLVLFFAGFMTLYLGKAKFRKVSPKSAMVSHQTEDPWTKEISTPPQIWPKIELTKDNPKTLLSTKSKDYTIHGLCLGITHSQAWQILGNTACLMGLKDDSNPSRIWVYGREPDGSKKGDSILYLIWEPGEETLSQITVFHGFQDSLSPTFRRLLTVEAVGDGSPLKRDLIGYPDRSAITYESQVIGMKTISYFYERV